MGKKREGGYLGGTPSSWSASVRPGMWSIRSQFELNKDGTWPEPPPELALLSRSLRFNSADSAFLSRTPASAGNRKTWTFSCWLKKCKNSSSDDIFSVSTGTEALRFDSDSVYYFADSGNVALMTTNAVLRDPSAWYHIILSVDTTQATASNRANIYINGTLQTLNLSQRPSLNYDTLLNNANALRIGGSNYLNGYLADIHFIDGQALDPTSFGLFDTNGIWQPIIYTGSYGTNGFHLDFADNSAATATTLGKDTSGNGNNWTPNNFSVGRTSITTPQWYASQTLYTTKADVLANATPKGTGSWTASNEFAYLIINDGGVPGTNNVWSSNFSLLTYVYRNTGGTYVNSGGFNTGEGTNFSWSNSVGTYNISNDQDFYLLADTRDGSNQPTADGYFSGAVPALVTSSFKTLNDLNLGNDSLVDVPTNGAQTDTGVGGEVRGNYPTLNPLAKGANTVLSNGNLDLTGTSTAAFNSAFATIQIPATGKWYFEFTVTAHTAGFTAPAIGVTTALSATTQDSLVGSNSNEFGWGADGYSWLNGSQTNRSLPSVPGDVMQLAIDTTNGRIWSGVNNTWAASGNPGAGTNPLVSSSTFAAALFVAVSSYQAQGAGSINFGQRPFAYTAPSGFKALNTANLPAPVITKPSTVMDVKLYTGNGGTQVITTGFSPDLVWIKSRSIGYGHRINDSVRGAQKFLYSNATDAEVTSTANDRFTSFDTTGFTLGIGGDPSADGLNQNTLPYVAWCWDAGSSTVTNTAGSITSQVRANPNAGFSVVSVPGYTYPTKTAGHGLGVEPHFIITKNRGVSNPWIIYHNSAGANTYFQFDTGAGYTGVAGVWSGVTSTVFPLNSGVNQQTDIVAYCFAPVAGYSSFGSYTGNGSSDGPFVFTGFRPRWILIKVSSTTNEWRIYDAARLGYNTVATILTPNDSQAEGTTGSPVDLLSNGFKVRGTDGSVNSSGATYIYAAFAESPLQYARAR